MPKTVSPERDRSTFSTLAHVLLAVCLCCAAALCSTAAHAERDTPVVTGAHWTNSTMQEKQAFLMGMATVIELEQEIRGGEVPAEACKSLIPGWVTGLSGHTLTQVLEGLDAWYAAHPDKLQTPVAEALWVDFVKPKLDN